VAVVVSVAFANTNIKGTTLLTLGGMVMCLAIVGLSLVLVTGYSGQVSLCQFSFMGIGAFVMGVMNNGMSIYGLGIYWQQVVKGIVLLAAVFIDIYQRNKG